MKKAVVLLSGGLDSTVCMAVAKSQGDETYPISFNYHQRHSIELEGAKKVADFFGVKKHLIIETNMEQIGGSALTDSHIDVPEGDTERADIPVTYVPARNLIFLSYALGYAEVVGASCVYIGVNAVDYSGYPDCRPEFVAAFEAMANLAVKEAVEGRLHIRIHTPLLTLSKAAIVRLGTSLGVDYGLTHSCYDPDPAGLACGRCDSCLLRQKGFEEAGVADPTRYRPSL